MPTASRKPLGPAACTTLALSLFLTASIDLLAQSQLTLENQTVTSTVVETAGEITAQNGYIVEAPGDVTFQFEASVTLKPGFHVKHGGKFKTVYSPNLLPPDNDNFANAWDLNARPDGDNNLATSEPGEPDHGGIGPNASVWWYYQPTQSGTIRVSTRLDKQGGLVLSVKDDGPGMTPEQVAAAKAPEQAGDMKHAGRRGLGLRLVLGFVHDNRGELDIHGQPGEGTDVRIRFGPDRLRAQKPGKTSRKPQKRKRE